MSGIASGFYRTVFKRTPVTVLTVMVTAFFFERALDQGCDYWFNKHNQGKLWPDVKKRLQLE